MKNKVKDEIKKFFPTGEFSLNEIRYKNGIFVGEFKMDGKNFVAKYFEKSADAIEIKYYEILKEIDVPTPKIFYSNSNLLIMENLNFSKIYHLATAEDLQNENVIKNLARWYKKLHTRAVNINKTGFYSELDFLNKNDLKNLKNLLPDCKNLDLMIENLEKINAKINALNLTLTYNDFALENMIAGENFSMMFDYNKMGRGIAYFDIQNVCFMLDEKMQKIFIDEYGAIPEIETTFYTLLIPFITLVLASKLPSFPNWANPYKTKIYSDEIKNIILQLIK